MYRSSYIRIYNIHMYTLGRQQIYNLVSLSLRNMAKYEVGFQEILLQ